MIDIDVTDAQYIKEDIFDHLKDARSNPKGRVHEVIELLEDKSVLEQIFNHTDISCKDHTANVRKYNNFCNAYMVYLFDQFVVEQDDVEIMQVAFNYFPKYIHIKKLTERRNLYAIEIYEPKHPEKKWGVKPTDKNRGLAGEEKRIMLGLADTLYELVNKHRGTLNLINDVLTELKSSNIETIKPDETIIKVDDESDDDEDMDIPDGADEEISIKEEKTYMWKRWALGAIFVIAVGLGCFVGPKYFSTNNLPDTSPDNIVNVAPPVAGGDSTGNNLDAEEELIPVSLTKEQWKIADEEMADLIDEAQASIAVYDESGAYDTEGICTLIYERIANNPIYGDMVTRGLLEADSMTDCQIQKYNPQLLEFVEETNTAFENPERYQEGMRRWLIKIYTTATPTDEYKEHANGVWTLLRGFFCAEKIYELRATSRWYIDSNENGIYTRAIKDSEKISQPALVLFTRYTSGRIGLVIGFLISDGSVVVCNPWEWGLDSFVG